MPEKKIKHLEMIETVIERMARNCFQLKGWAMTLVTLVGALGAQGSNKKFMLFAFIPILGFWFLDAFYLKQERKYQQLYKNVMVKKEEEIDFDLDSSHVTGTVKEMERLCIGKCIFSTSVAVFYGVIAVAMIALFIVLKKM